MKHLPARHRRRNRNFDFNSMRRAEIVRHAIHVGAMDTDDRDRWLLAYALHNPGAKDQVLSLMQTARRMGGEITEVDANAIADEAAQIPYPWKADRLARHLRVTYQQRTILGITTIGACDLSRAQRRKQRKQKDRIAKERNRRASGVLARTEYEANSTAAKARAEGVSRMTIYRRKRATEQPKNAPHVTGVSAAYLLSSDDRPVTSEGKGGCPSGAVAPKEGSGYPSSQTAATLAADKYASLPLELRMIALGLPVGRVPAFAFGRRAA